MSRYQHKPPVLSSLQNHDIYLCILISKTEIDRFQNLIKTILFIEGGIKYAGSAVSFQRMHSRKVSFFSKQKPKVSLIQP